MKQNPISMGRDSIKRKCTQYRWCLSYDKQHVAGDNESSCQNAIIQASAFFYFILTWFKRSDSKYHTVKSCQPVVGFVLLSEKIRIDEPVGLITLSEKMPVPMSRTFLMFILSDAQIRKKWSYWEKISALVTIDWVSMSNKCV